MKKTMGIVIAFISFIVFICSCSSGPPFLFGPAFPKQGAEQFLNSTGTPTEIINRIIDQVEMSQEDFEKYSKSDNIDVRFLIASNPHTPIKLLDILARDNKRFVRQGVALNTSIDYRIIELLKNDPYYYIQCMLVRNIAVPEDVILWIYKNNKKVPLYYYGRNPQCPKIIKNDILKSNDKEAKFWLDYTTKKGREKNKE